MNVSLTPELEKFVHQEVGSGLYPTPSEVIRAGLRRLQEDREKCQMKMPSTKEELEAELCRSLDRLDRGEGVSGEEVFQRVRQKIEKSQI